METWGEGVEKLRNKTMALHAAAVTGVRPAPINGTGDMKDIGINFIGSVHLAGLSQDGSVGPAGKVLTLCGPPSSCNILPITGFNEDCRTWSGPVARLKLVCLSDTGRPGAAISDRAMADSCQGRSCRRRERTQGGPRTHVWLGAVSVTPRHRVMACRPSEPAIPGVPVEMRC